MPKQIAGLGDQTQHGGAITSGCTTVLAEGKPVARIGDMHTCPMTTGMTPHVGGPIVGPGEPTVLVESKPVATAGDNVTCNGPPDKIVFGCLTVYSG